MEKDDKELGKWISTATVGITTIKRFKKGFSIKKRGESITEKLRLAKDTTVKDMTNLMVRFV